MSKKLRQRAMMAVKKQMLESGELVKEWDDTLGAYRLSNPSAPDSIEVREGIVDELERSTGHDATRKFRSNETPAERENRVQARKDSLMEKHGALHRFKVRGKWELRQKQRAAGSDQKGRQWKEVDPGMPCRILPQMTVDDSGNIVPVSSGTARGTVQEREQGIVPGNIVTALFTEQHFRYGKLNVRCLLPDGRHVDIPCLRLEPLNDQLLDTSDEDEDLFEPEDDE